ncbi:MAG: DUF433 domain-containing protein [Acidobacteriota bacterium]
MARSLIDHDAQGVPFIAGTTMKVVELVVAQRAYGWRPEELARQFPHLSMAGIQAALAYYEDHAEALDADIAQRARYAATARAKAANSPLAQRLAALKRQRVT